MSHPIADLAPEWKAPWPMPVLRLLAQIWYREHFLFFLLLPLSWLYQAVVRGRRLAYRRGLLAVQQVGVPVIIVGNLVVGGSGKTPLTVRLVEICRELGYRPGIASRGYGGQARRWPQQVRADADPLTVGEEPILLARRARCPVVADPDRVRAAEALQEHYNCDLVICDDGLQHLRLARNIEISVVDGRRYGNQYCLPAGPLREPLQNLKRVDMVVSSGRRRYAGEFQMRYQELGLHALGDSDRRCRLLELSGHRVHAVAGIGVPENFFALLERNGLRLIRHPFPDHYRFRRKDIRFADNLPIVMTEKDAIKCEPYATGDCWYLRIEASVQEVFKYRLQKLLERSVNGQKAA